MVVQLPPDREALDETAEVEAGVIDDARARHRRERGAGAIIAALAVAIGFVFWVGGGGGEGGAGRHGGSGGPPSGANHTPSRPLAVISGRGVSAYEFGLLSPSTGWAVLRNSFDVTRDGGRRWTQLSTDTRHGNRYGAESVRGFRLTGDFTANITATTSPSARVLAIGFVDGHAAGSCQPPRAPATGAGALLLTTDAARSWSTHILPGCGTAASLSFVNARVGYAVLTPAIRDSELYRTVDGARSWQLVSRFPAPMAVSFGTRADGLAFVTPNTKTAAGLLYHTIDGGRTWQRSRICGDTPDPTVTVYCGSPVSFGARGVVLAISQNLSKAHADHAYLYTTADAGRRWTRHELPAIDSPEMPAFSAPDARDLFVYSMNGVLHTSTNGGRSWSSIPQPAFRELEQMQFTGAGYGWVLAGRRFESTRDGGRSWTPVGTA